MTTASMNSAARLRGQDAAGMAHPDDPAVGLRDLPDDLYDYARPPNRRIGRPPKTDPATWTVTDDWPARVPVTEAEIALFEGWFGDLFDSLFGPDP